MHLIIQRAFCSNKDKNKNKNKDNLILGKGQTKRVDNTSLIAETEYSINFSRSERKFCLNFLYYNGSNSFLFRKIHQFKGEDSERKKYPLCLGSISNNFPVDNMKKTGLNSYIYDFSVDYHIFNFSNIIDIDKYLMKNQDIK